MSKASFRVYICADCKTRRQVRVQETWRRKRLQCCSCGSYYLDASKPAAEEQAHKHTRSFVPESILKVGKR